MPYLMPTQDAGRRFVQQGIEGPVVMLNLLRFRDVADYSASPELAPSAPISGRDAYEFYVQHTLPFLGASGGSILFSGSASSFLIGPESERWDAVLLVQQQSIESFLAFENNAEYLAGIGHRTAAIEDSRLLPVVEDALATGVASAG